LGGGGGAGAAAATGAGGGGAAGAAGADAGAGAAGSAAGAGAGAGAAAWAVGAGSAAGAAGAGPLLHPPSNSNPLNASESMPAEAYVACLVARPPVEWIALDKVCLFMILSLDAKVSAPSCQARLFQLFLNQRVSRSFCAVMLSNRGLHSIFARPGVDLKSIRTQGPAIRSSKPCKPQTTMNG
jgi:hypothetical protein